MSENFEIRSPQFPHDMSAWCTEKSSNVAQAVSRALDLVSQCDRLDGGTKEMLRFYLSSSLYDISKLLPFSTGADWSVSDARDIQENGYDGYQRLAVRYGILHQTDAGAKLSCIENFCDALSKLLWGERSPNRTFVHELLNRTALDHPIVKKAEETIELVTMGQLDWKDFCRTMDAEVKKISSENSLQATQPCDDI